MGMWDKDRLYGGARLDDAFNVGNEFILYDGEILSEHVPMDSGQEATKTLLAVARIDDPTKVFIVGTLARAIAEKIKEKDDGDLPAVVKKLKVPSSGFDNEAVVLQFVSPWTGVTASDLPAWDTYLEQDDSLILANNPLSSRAG